MISQVLEYAGRAIELRRLAQHPARPLARPCRLESRTARRAVWRIILPDGPDRYMSAHSGEIDVDMYVVQVDGLAFYRAWLEGCHFLYQRRPDHCPVRSKMPRDYKFAGASDGFSRGVENAVPLAEVSARVDAVTVSIAFTNGIARSLWLIANHAASFPVQVYGRESADALHAVAGVGECPLWFADLFNVPELRAVS